MPLNKETKPSKKEHVIVFIYSTQKLMNGKNLCDVMDIELVCCLKINNSFFLNGISTFCRLFNAKAILLEEQ